MKFFFDQVSYIGNDKINIIFLSDFKQLPKVLGLGADEITRVLKSSKDFTCRINESIISTIKINGFYKRFLFYGIGSTQELNRVKLQKLGANIADKLNSIRVSEAGIFFENITFKENEVFFITNICEGIKLKNYIFDRYFFKKKDINKIYLQEVKIHCSNSSNVAKFFLDREKIVNATHFARDLISEPANVLNPDTFVDKCKELSKLGVQVKVLDKKKLENLGMNAILAVGQGSSFGTYAVSMEWNGDKDSKNNRPIAFIGKGVTFDSGGIDLKPSGHSINKMKYDMGGAAVITGLIKSLAERSAKVNAIGVIGLVENMPSSLAQRPGDVITSMSGQTIEVDNTDAEGRLLLADVMWYTQESFKPRIMIDLATLTGAIIFSLGYHNAGIFSNDDDLAKKLYQAGKEIGEKVWRLPLDECYDQLIDSEIADIRNIGKHGAGSIAAAQFLKRFVQKDCVWAHIDIAGVNWLDEGGEFSPKGATGYGVRLLNEFLIKNYEK